MSGVDYRYELRRGEEIVATGRLTRELPLEVGARVIIGAQEGIVRLAEPVLGGARAASGRAASARRRLAWPAEALTKHRACECCRVHGKRAPLMFEYEPRELLGRVGLTCFDSMRLMLPRREPRPLVLFHSSFHDELVRPQAWPEQIRARPTAPKRTEEPVSGGESRSARPVDGR